VASSNSPAAGTIRWNPSTVDFEGYDGSGWKSLTGLPSPPPPPSYQVGDFEDQGVVFFVSPDGKTVKFVAIEEISNGVQWSTPSNINVSGAESNLNGFQNSEDIANDNNLTSSAAEMCRSLNIGGHNDWYLPAINELESLLSVAPTIGQIIRDNLGDSVSGFPHWSSTEVVFSGAYGMDKTSTNPVLFNKADEWPIRAIRTVTFP